MTVSDNFDQLPLRWDMKKPNDFDIHYWRRTQLKRYINKFPNDKRKKILDKLEKHTSNPWPECNTEKLSELVNDVKKTEHSHLMDLKRSHVLVIWWSMTYSL